MAVGAQRATSRAAMDAIREVHDGFRAHATRRLVEAGITFPQATSLYLLQKNGAMTLSDLAAGLATTQPNASGIVARLERDGLVRRSRSTTDKRVSFVTLTDAGREKISGIVGIMELAVDEAFAGLSAIEAAEFARLAGKLRARVEGLTAGIVTIPIRADQAASEPIAAGGTRG